MRSSSTATRPVQRHKCDVGQHGDQHPDRANRDALSVGRSQVRDICADSCQCETGGQA